VQHLCLQTLTQVTGSARLAQWNGIPHVEASTAVKNCFTELQCDQEWLRFWLKTWHVGCGRQAGSCSLA